MKLAVINFSGNVGKTTVARHLLAPRIPGCELVSVESINADEGQPVTIRGRQFAPVLEDSEDADSQPEEPTPHPTRRPKPGKKNR